MTQATCVIVVPETEALLLKLMPILNKVRLFDLLAQEFCEQIGGKRDTPYGLLTKWNNVVSSHSAEVKIEGIQSLRRPYFNLIIVFCFGKEHATDILDIINDD